MITGNAANNVLSGGAGADILIGGAGNDTYVVDNIGDMVTESLNEGTDRVNSSIGYLLGSNIEVLQLTGTSNINGTGNSLDNTVYASAGNNVLDGGAGTDTLSYNYATSAVQVSLASTLTQTTGGSGSDTILNFENLYGSAYNDQLTGNAANNVLNGGVGADTLVGGAGNDTYVVDNIGDMVTESLNEGTDRVNSSIGYLLGSNIEVLQLTGTSNINGTGNSLNNTVYASAGNNVLDGGAGTDTLSYNYATSAVQVSLASTLAQTTGGSGSDTILNFENLYGSAYNDQLTGNAANNVLNGGVGADTLIGGLGNDSYTIENVGDVVIENLNEGTDKVNSYISYTLGNNVEDLQLVGANHINGTGNSLNNTIYASAGNNVLDGGAGTDILSYYYETTAVTVSLATNAAQTTGGSGSDTILNFENLYGSAYNDTLTGSALDNLINGQSGNDIINGGLGNDTLYGGQGQDTFVLSTGLNVSTNKDTIADFVTIDDVIHLDNSIFTKLIATGTLDTNFFKSSLNGTATDIDDYILYNTTTGALNYDADGSGVGGAVAFAVLGTSTHPTISYMDFVVI